MIDLQEERIRHIIIDNIFETLTYDLEHERDYDYGIFIIEGITGENIAEEIKCMEMEEKSEYILREAKKRMLK